MKKLICILIATSVASTAYAEKKSPEQVIVTGTRSNANEIKIPANINIISAEDIRLSGASSITEILEGQVGIVIQDNIGSKNRGATISMRGFSETATNNVLILVDGRKLNNPTLAAPDLGSISIKDIERVEIINGSAGTLYGEQSSGGVINIITKKPEELTGNIEVSRGNRDHESYTGNVSDKFDNGINYRVSGEKRLDDNYRDNNEASYENTFANIGYENTSGSAFVEIQNINDDMNYPGFLSYSDIKENRKQSQTLNDFGDNTTDVYRVGGFYNLTAGWEAGGEYTYRDEEGKGNLYSPFTDSTTIKTWNPRINGESELFGHNTNLTIGSDLQDTEYRSNAYSLADFHQDIDDIYAQAIIDITDQLSLTTGGRHSQLSENNRANAQKNDDDLEVYQIGFAYKLDNSQRVFIRRDESFRWANVDENALTLPSIDFLKPQTSTSNELGYEFKDGKWTATVVLFQIDLEDELIYDSEIANPNSYFGSGANINLDESEREGLTLSGSWKINDQWKLSANGSFIDSEFTSGSFDGKEVPYVANKTASTTITYMPTSQLSLYAQAVYTGNRYAASDYTNDYDKLGGYTTFNANIRYELNNWYTQLRIDNAGNKQYNGFTYAGGGGYPAAEATTQVSVGYTF